MFSGGESLLRKGNSVLDVDAGFGQERAKVQGSVGKKEIDLSLTSHRCKNFVQFG